jgi:cation diffusion facilitator CzcD-associated flavoprotein CzcO
LSDFEGRWVHSTDWDDTLEVDDANVAVIGTGSTSAQIVGALGERCQKLDVYQRTPQWMFPLFQKRYSTPWKWVMGHVPGMHKIMYWLHRQTLEMTLGPATMGNKVWQRIFQWMCKRNLHKTVKDSKLRAKLTPDYKAACKRLVICSTFYKSIVRKNVELVTEAIEKIEPEGVRTVDGQLRKADTLVLCTGFHTDRYLLPVHVVGREGKILADEWAGAPRAHRATSVPSFPNLWFIQGPTGPVGNISLVAVSEIQIKFIIQCLDKMKEDKLAVVESSKAAYQQFNDDLKRSVQKTIWATGGCQSWYIDSSGDPNLYSHPPRQFYRDMKHPVFSEFRVESAASEKTS